MLTPGAGVLGGSAVLGLGSCVGQLSCGPQAQESRLYPSASLASDPQGVLYQRFRASASAGMRTEAAP